MRKRDKLKDVTPILFIIMYTYIFQLGELPVTKYPALIVGLWLLLVLGSVILTDKMIDFFDKNDNEEDE